MEHVVLRSAMLMLILASLVAAGCGDDGSSEPQADTAAGKSGEDDSDLGKAGDNGSSASAGTESAGHSGGAGTSAAGSAGGPPPEPGSFSDLYQNSFKQCRNPNCHGKGAVGLNMGTEDEAFATLIDVPPAPNGKCVELGKVRVKPGDPENSLLYLKLDINSPCGQQMPPGGSNPPAFIEKVRKWIADGANR
jgi:hypothetical protein